MATATTPTEPVVDPVQPEGTEPAVETPAEGAAPDDGGAPAPVAEGEGSRPVESPSTPPPALGSDDPDVSFALGKHNNDPKALAKDWTRLNNLLPTLQKDREELERLRAAAATPGREPVGTEPARIERPAPNAEQLAAESETRAKSFVRTDRYAKAWQGEFMELLPEVEKLGVYDPESRSFVSGALAEMDDAIATIKANIKSAENPRPGVPALGWGEFEIGEAKRELKTLEFDRRSTLAEWKEKKARTTELADLYDARFDQAKTHFGKQLGDQISQQQEQAQVVQIAKDFEVEQKTAFSKVCDELQIRKDPAARADLERRFKFHFLATRLVPGKENPTMSPQETEAAVRDFITGERKYAGNFTEEAVRAYAEAKKADSRGAAPKGKAAIVATEREDPEAWKRRWEVDRAQPVLDRIKAKRMGR